jgi:hypothetical protein
MTASKTPMTKPLLLSSRIALLAIALAACGGPAAAGRITYTDPDKRSLLSIPDDWHLYEPADLGDLQEAPFVEDYDGLTFPVETAVAFDGSPERSLENLAIDLVDAAFPLGLASVRTVGESERDFLSRAALTQSVVPYLALGQAQEVTKEDFSFGDGFEGVRVLVAFTDDGGRSVGVAYLISVTDPTDEHLYSVVAGCSRQCFIDHQSEIEEVVDSWLVNTRG